MTKTKVFSLFTEFDINLFKAGKHYRLYEKFGSHITTLDGEEGTYFAVWAPSASISLSSKQLEKQLGEAFAELERVAMSGNE